MVGEYAFWVFSFCSVFQKFVSPSFRLNSIEWMVLELVGNDKLELKATVFN